MNTELHISAAQYVGILNDEALVCHAGVMQAALMKGVKRVHRMVTLPEYQGIGIGTHFIDFIAGLYSAEGFRFNLITTTPALRFALEKSKNWKLRRSGYVKRPGDVRQLSEERYNIGHIVKSFSCDRITHSFDYVGEPAASAEIKVNSDKRVRKTGEETQLTLF